MNALIRIHLPKELREIFNMWHYKALLVVGGFLFFVARTYQGIVARKSIHAPSYTVQTSLRILSIVTCRSGLIPSPVGSIN